MASGQKTGCPQLKDLTCSICLNIYTDPRLLPCHHSFCSSCIEDVANSNGGKTFPCSICRVCVRMPSNRVAGFQRNFYLSGELENIAAVRFYCPNHDRDELDMYCTECKVPACHKCARTKHTEPTRNHRMENLSDAAKKSKGQLVDHKNRIATAVRNLKKTVAATEQEKQDIQTQKAILKKDITNRHANMIAAANKARDDALAKLTKTVDRLEKELNNDLASEKQDLAAVEKLQRNVEDAINRDVHCKVVEVAKEMAEGSGSTRRIERLTTHNRTKISRPVLESSESSEKATEIITKYIGRVDREDIKSKPKSKKASEKREECVEESEEEEGEEEEGEEGEEENSDEEEERDSLSDFETFSIQRRFRRSLSEKKERRSRSICGEAISRNPASKFPHYSCKLERVSGNRGEPDLKSLELKEKKKRS